MELLSSVCRSGRVFGQKNRWQSWRAYLPRGRRMGPFIPCTTEAHTFLIPPQPREREDVTKDALTISNTWPAQRYDTLNVTAAPIGQPRAHVSVVSAGTPRIEQSLYKEGESVPSTLLGPESANEFSLSVGPTACDFLRSYGSPRSSLSEE